MKSVTKTYNTNNNTNYYDSGLTSSQIGGLYCMYISSHSVYSSQCGYYYVSNGTIVGSNNFRLTLSESSYGKIYASSAATITVTYYYLD